MELKPGYKRTEVGVTNSSGTNLDAGTSGPKGGGMDSRRIPEDWRIAPLGEVVTFQRGFDLPQRDRNDGSVPIISSAGPTGLHDQAMAEPPGVVTGRYGTIGEVFFIETPYWPLNTTLYVRDFHGNDCHFVYYLLHTFDFETFSGKSGVPGVNRNDLHAETVALPARGEEQRAIATALSNADALLDALDRLIAKKRDLKQAAMQQLLTGQARLPGFSGEWGVRVLDEVSECLDHLRIPLNETQRASMQGDIPYCGANGVLDYIDKHLIDDDVILVAEDGGYFDEYKTRPIAYRMKGRIWVNNHAHILKTVKGVDQGFLFYSLVHKNILPYLASGTRAKLNKSELSKIKSKFPLDLSEQTAIAAILSDMDAELDALETRRTKTAALKQAMMQELLIGRTRLPLPANAEATA